MPENTNNRVENAETATQARGCFQLIDIMIFAYGAFIMFGKTANLLGKFAPDDWFGLTPSDYGFASAILIEGYLVMMKFKAWILPPKNFVEWGADIVVTITPFLLSAYAQAADAWFTTNIVQNMTAEEQMKITNIISFLVPAILLLAIVRTAIETAPAGLFDNIKTKRSTDDVGGFFRGIGRILGRRNAQTNTVQNVSKTLTQDDLVRQDVPDGNNGKRSEEPNFR
jgi:hypothetical protein